MKNKEHRMSFILLVKIIFIFIFILTCISDVFSQQNKYEFEKPITNQENFPLSINCVIKDKKGFMWFGTGSGLYRFDGYNFKVYSFKIGDSTSLSNNTITSIYNDDKYLWIGTLQGLNRFDKTTEQFKTYKFSYIDDFIYAICPTSINELWIGTSNGLNKFDMIEEKFTKYKNVPDDTLGQIYYNEITTLFEDGDSNLWIGTRKHGLDKYDIKNKIFKHYKFNQQDSKSLSNEEVIKILEDIKRNLWIATDGGLNKFDKKTETFKKFLYDSLNEKSLINNEIGSMTIDTDQNIWLGTSQGICIHDPNTNNFTNLTRENNLSPFTNISNIYCDNHGMVWIYGKNEKVFGVYNKSKWRFNSYKNNPGDNKSLTDNSVLSICEDNLGNFWIGSFHGIDILNNQKEKIRHLYHNPKDSLSLGNDNIWSIYKDKKNFMWIGTNGGPLDRYDADKDVFTHFYDFDGKVFTVTDIFEDNKENLWVGLLKGGIRVFDKNRTLIKKYLHAPGDSSYTTPIPVDKIFEDSKKIMWIGTRAGLATIDLKTDNVTFYKNNPNDSNTLSGNKAYSINEDENGNLWIGTSNGLNNFDIIKKKFNHYNNIKDGGYDFIFCLLKDFKGNFWTTSDRGVSMFKLNERTFTNFGLSDGLQGTFILSSDFKASDGEIFFGGYDGFNSFYPDSIKINENIPNIVLTNFKIFNKEVKLDTSITEKKVITISYKENFFSFDYAALDYFSPEKNQHAYMLEGIDKDWNNVGNTRTANYTNIEPGEYTFRVKGSNNDGVWNEKGTSVILIITPPWYKTFWFKGLIAVLLIGGTGFIFSQRIRKIRKEKVQQEEFTKKLIESQESERKRVAAELHDSLGQDLLIIKNKALISLKKSDDVAKLKEDIREISELTTSSINEVREISYNLRPYELDRLGLLKTLQSLIDRAGKSTNISFNCDIDNIDTIFVPEVEINVYRIVQECLSNIIKHSEATQVIVHIKKLEKEISIFISDNGKGFNVEKKFSDSQRKGFGLRGIPERVKLFGGEFNLESEPGKGTRIKIVMPVPGHSL